MSQQQSFILLQRLEDLATWLFPVVDKWPKAEKFAACTEVKQAVYRLMRQAIRIQKLPRGMRREYLDAVRELDQELEYLRILLRQAAQRRQQSRGAPWLGQRGQKHAAQRLDEIGRIVGGLFRQAGGEGRQP